jgi:hypothetical protein
MLEKFLNGGLGENFFQKVPPPTIRLGSRFRGNDPFFSFREKRKVSKRKATQRFQRSELLGTSASCAHLPHARKVFERGLGGELFSKSSPPTSATFPEAVVYKIKGFTIK